MAVKKVYIYSASLYGKHQTDVFHIVDARRIFQACWGRTPSEHDKVLNPGEYQAPGFTFFFAGSTKNRVHFTADAGKVFIGRKNSKIHSYLSGVKWLIKHTKNLQNVYLFR